MKLHVLFALLIGLLVGSCCSPMVLEPVVVEAKEETFDEELFNFVINRLMEECPLNDDAMVKVMVITSARWGMTMWSHKYGYEITLEARQQMHSILDVLEHEWAHAMVWDSHQDSDHGPLWGVAWAKAYRVSLQAQRDYYAQ